LPANIGNDTYRFRIIATNPNISSGNNGFDIKYNQPIVTIISSAKPAVCRNKPFALHYISSECFEDDNIFYLEMSDEQHSFGNPIILGFSYDLLNGKFNFTIPESVPFNKTYLFRVRSTNPAANFVQNHIEFSVRGPEILTGNLYKTITQRNDTLYVPFNCNCLEMEDKVFVVQLSDPYGNFNKILTPNSRIG
jgi:hypothetical protein